MDIGLHIANFSASGIVCNPCDDLSGVILHTADMPNRNNRSYFPVEHHLKEWREFRNMTQAQLADAVETDKSVISLLENGGMQMTDSWARRLAKPLRTTAGFLIDYGPDELPTDILDAARAVSVEHRPQVIEILKAFRRRG